MSLKRIASVTFRTAAALTGAGAVYLATMPEPAALSPRCPVPLTPAFSRSAESANGERIACLVDPVVARRFELYSVPAVSGAAVRISPAMADDRDVIDFAISPDAVTVAFTADPYRWTQYELFTVAIGGGPVKRVSAPLASDFDVDTFLWTRDGSRIVYRHGRNALGKWALSSCQPGGGFVLQVSQAGFTVSQGFSTAWDGSFVRFLAEPEGAGGSPSAWVASAVAPSRVFGEIFASGFEGGGLAAWSGASS